MKIKFLVPALLSFTTIAYSGLANNEAHIDESGKSEIRIHTGADQEGIVLNNGEKWVVNPEMMTYVRTIEKAVDELAESGSASMEEHQQLAKLINTNLNGLTSSCTMKGKAHDELHKWLLPFISDVKSYADSADKAKAVNNLNKIEESFETFNTYFI